MGVSGRLEPWPKECEGSSDKYKQSHAVNRCWPALGQSYQWWPGLSWLMPPTQIWPRASTSVARREPVWTWRCWSWCERRCCFWTCHDFGYADDLGQVWPGPLPNPCKFNQLWIKSIWKKATSGIDIYRTFFSIIYYLLNNTLTIVCTPRTVCYDELSRDNLKYMRGYEHVICKHSAILYKAIQLPRIWAWAVVWRKA